MLGAGLVLGVGQVALVVLNDEGAAARLLGVGSDLGGLGHSQVIVCRCVELLSPFRRMKLPIRLRQLLLSRSHRRLLTQHDSLLLRCLLMVHSPPTLLRLMLRRKLNRCSIEARPFFLILLLALRCDDKRWCCLIIHRLGCCLSSRLGLSRDHLLVVHLAN